MLSEGSRLPRRSRAARAPEGTEGPQKNAAARGGSAARVEAREAVPPARGQPFTSRLRDSPCLGGIKVDREPPRLERTRPGTPAGAGPDPSAAPRRRGNGAILSAAVPAGGGRGASMATAALRRGRGAVGAGHGLARYLGCSRSSGRTRACRSARWTPGPQRGGARRRRHPWRAAAAAAEPADLSSVLTSVPLRRGCCCCCPSTAGDVI